MLDVGEIQARQRAADRRYFEEHPAERVLLRPLTWGEFLPLAAPPAGSAWVRVTYLTPDSRLRELVPLDGSADPIN